MTDQPDRPDGDGLLLECPCCGSASEPSTAFDGSIYEGHVVVCVSGKCGCQSGVFPTPAMAHKAWNTRVPTRDGAEGAGEVQDTWFSDSRLPIIAMSGDAESDGVLKLHFRRKVTDADRARLVEVLNAGELALSAPPKPAPDAMRKALESLADWCSTERAKIGAIDGYDYRSGEEFGLRRAELEITKRTLSAPAPPADGPTEIVLEESENLAGDIIQTVRLADGKEVVRSAPSPAVAAEPVSDTDKAFIDAIYKCDMETRKAVVAFLSGAAGPTVGGDREEIARIIEENIYHKHNGNWDGDRKDLLVAADAILSLPVQPGAGEREALAALEPFTKLGGGQNPRDAAAGLYYAAYYDLPGDTVVYENSGACITADDVRTARRVYKTLSRQTPHSSGETES